MVVEATFVMCSGELLVHPTPTSSRHLCHRSVGYLVTKLLGGNVGGEHIVLFVGLPPNAILSPEGEYARLFTLFCQCFV
jgi:hypothetical protein